MDAELISSFIGLITAALGIWQTYAARASQRSAAAAGLAQSPPGMLAPASSASTMRPTLIRIGPVLRDAGLIILGTGIVGFFLGYASGGDMESVMMAAGWINVIGIIIGLMISGAVAQHRWRHIFATAIMVWALSIVNVALGIVDTTTWIFAIFLVAICAIVGGALSYVFKR
jgi:hypothetical protein